LQTRAARGRLDQLLRQLVYPRLPEPLILGLVDRVGFG
jgi:hypothetical protein